MAIVADTLDGWLAALEQLHPTPIELGLSRIQAVAERMALLALPCPLITVAGTNGKGSTVTYLDAIYRAAGYRTCCQFSPHMVHFNERIRLNGVDASDAQILKALAEVEQSRGEISLTYFEYTVLAAMWLYRREKPDVIILEVGLGGRLDACNIWDCDTAVITNIAVDHQRWLGDTRDAIAPEKAAIARAGRPVIVGDVNPPNSLVTKLHEIGAEAHFIERDFSIEPAVEGWTFKNADGVYNLPNPALAGDWQLANAACAVSAVHQLMSQLPVQQQAIGEGLQSAHIAGRYQRGTIEGVDVVMDVGHNPDAARRLASQLSAESSYGKTFAVSAVMADKDIDGILQHLSANFDAWYLGGLTVDRAMLPRQYAQHLAGFSSSPVDCFATIQQALEAAIAAASPNDRVVVFGSFYTVAELVARI